MEKMKLTSNYTRELDNVIDSLRANKVERSEVGIGKIEDAFDKGYEEGINEPLNLSKELMKPKRAETIARVKKDYGRYFGAQEQGDGYPLSNDSSRCYCTIHYKCFKGLIGCKSIWYKGQDYFSDGVEYAGLEDLIKDLENPEITDENGEYIK